MLAALVVVSGGCESRGEAVPVPLAQAVVLDPYDDPLLLEYQTYRSAVLAGDAERLQTLADGRDSFIAYRAALTLARMPLSAAERVHYYRRVLSLRIDDPLDRLAEDRLLLEYARTAEAAGFVEEALEAYEAALPDAAAVSALERLQTDPYKLANTFLQARRWREALQALGERSAPSIEAPAYRALGQYDEALEAYESWLEKTPNDVDAQTGLAWTNYYLENYEAADALFRDLGTDGLRGRALIAKRAGDVDRAVALLAESEDATNLWWATGYLEADERYREALPLYLQLARGSSIYTDDAAYRAYVLAERLGETALVEEAQAYLPANTFFALKAGEAVELTFENTLEEVTPEVVPVTAALARVGDLEAARGELLFALRDAVDVAERVALAAQLQRLGEFRQSQRTAADLLEEGVTDRRVWELAYPQAYAGTVGAEAARYALEPALIWAVMRQESAFFPEALSRSGAKGLMQFMPATWDEVAGRLKEPAGNPFVPEDSIRYGAYYLSWLIDYLGDIELAVPAYNGGPGYIKRLYEADYVDHNKDEFYREIDKQETREYLQAVLKNYAVYQALYEAADTTTEVKP